MLLAEGGEEGQDGGRFGRRDRCSGHFCLGTLEHQHGNDH